MDNKQILLDRALELFSLRGYDAVSVQDVVDAAGVTKPTLYHYFASKRGVLDALIVRESGHLLAGVMGAGAYQGDLVKTLETITRTYFQIAQDHSAFYRMQLAMYFSPPESETNQAIRPVSKKQQAFLEDIFLRAAGDHGNMRGRHRRYAAGFLGVIHAMIGLFLNGELTLTDEVVYLTVHQFMHGIFS